MSATKSGIQLESHMVIRRPLVTEKGVHASEALNAYAFEVHQQATKVDIKKAVEELWEVRVVAVRVVAVRRMRMTVPF